MPATERIGPERSGLFARRREIPLAQITPEGDPLLKVQEGITSLQLPTFTNPGERLTMNDSNKEPTTRW
jgi:hypothetical protein